MERHSCKEIGFCSRHYDTVDCSWSLFAYMALGTLHGALPDATYEELQAYDDECAICREPMAKAKKLSCHHLFHLVCLRSWLDQGLNDNYSCPTCRKPLFVGRPEDEANPHAREVSSDEQLARHISSRLDQQIPPTPPLPAGVLPDQTMNPLESADGRTYRAANENLASILAMAETVREVLPHIPDELIFQDVRNNAENMCRCNVFGK